MASFGEIFANIRIVNEDRRSVCSINNVDPIVTAQAAACELASLSRMELPVVERTTLI